MRWSVVAVILTLLSVPVYGAAPPPWVSVGAAMFFDDSFHRMARDVAPADSTARKVTGAVTSMGTYGVGATLAALSFVDRDVAADGIRAVTYAAAVTYLLKSLVGRSRPPETGVYGFTLNDRHHSFPSGHTAVSFALAEVIGEAYPHWKGAAIAVASAVGISRLLLERHWASDVVAGAYLGAGIGRAVARGRIGWEWSW